MRKNHNANKVLATRAPDGRTIFTKQLPAEQLPDVYELNRTQLKVPVADIAVAHLVLSRNADAFWGVYSASDARGTDARLIGYLAYVMLNADGEAALLAGRFDRGNPDIAHQCETGERPAAIYMWAVVARGVGMTAIPLTTHALGSLHRGLRHYGTAGTEAGLRTFKTYGFKALHEGHDGLGDLFWIDKARDAPTEQARAPALISRFKVAIATATLEVEQAFAIRAAVFMAEQECPFAEEFDGNDHTASHVVGYVDGEPAATLRIRYFADFVKIERMAVLPRYRGTLIAHEVVEVAINFCREKGYARIYGHAQKRLLNFWGRFGYRPTEPRNEFTFSDHEYVEVAGELPPHPAAMRIGGDPLKFLRPEGSWDTPGILEQSASRPASNPVGRQHAGT